MGQITESFARTMLEQCARKEHPSLTVWEAEQLARAWLRLAEAVAALHEIAHAHDSDARRLRLMAADALIRHNTTDSAPAGYDGTPTTFYCPRCPCERCGNTIRVGASSASVGRECQTLAALDSEDAARFRWLCDDHADKAARHLRDSLLERMSMMSLSAVRAAIGTHLINMSEQAKSKDSHHE